MTAWGAVQLGVERIAGPFQADASSAPLELRLIRGFVVGQIGIGIGFRRVRVLAEMGIERDWVGGTLGGVDRSFAVTSLAPAFAIAIRL